MTEDIGIGLLGLGTVGGGVYKILNEHADVIRRRAGAGIAVRAILEKDASRADALGVDRALLTSDFEAMLARPDIQVIVELFGGVEPARTFILQAIAAGKNVVTANKELLSTHGQELFEAAEGRGVDIFFEASVGGGIPIIRPLKECLAGNTISLVAGIVNGTTNYILTRMTDEGCDFAEALAEAQARGYAERDPAADIEGQDAAAKIAILASIAFNSRVTRDQVYTEGISKVTAKDIAYARELGFRIKLLALAKQTHGSLEVRVHPTMILADHPLASVRGVFNAIFVEGDAVGEVMFFGQGAGSMAAGSAVAGDIIAIARNIVHGGTGRIGCTCYESRPVLSIGETTSSFYLLLEAADRPGVLAKISQAFGEKDVSVASVIQRGPRGETAELMFITHPVLESNFRLALEAIEELDVVERVLNVIRVGTGDGE